MKETTQTHGQSPARQGRSGIFNLLHSGLLALALLCGLSASAQTITTTTNFTVNGVVPDGDPSGRASATNVSTPVVYITGLKVNLKLSGTFNGDLYCYLTHGAGDRKSTRLNSSH